MTFLARPFLAVCLSLAALLFWQRPAPFLFSMTPPDWAKEYEDAHTPADRIWGAMDMAREIVRASQKHRPLTEFIEEHLAQDSVTFQDREWRDWYEKHFFSDESALGDTRFETLYFRPSDLPSSRIPFERGHICIRGENSIRFLRIYKTPARELVGKNIQSDILHPYWNVAILLLAASLGLAAAGYFTGESRDLAAESFPGKGLKATAAIFASGLALTALPFLNFDPEGSPPFVFLGGFISLSGMIGFVLFAFYFNNLRKILDGRDLLAHWTIEPDEWKNFVEEEYRRERSAKWKLFLLVSVVIVLVGAGFRLLAEQEDAANIVLLVLAGLIALLWFVAMVLPNYFHIKKSKRPGEVFVGMSGVYIGGSFHSWRFPGSRLESVEFESGSSSRLNFVYSYVMFTGRSLNAIRQPVVFSVPIPEEMEREAKRIPARFGFGT